MSVDPEWDAASSELSYQISLLCDGWSERREYAVHVNSHTECRVESIWHPGLLVQLRTMTHPLIRPKQEGGSGAKPGSKPPGAFEAAALLDEVAVYANEQLTRPLRTTVGRALRLLRDTSHLRTAEDMRGVSWELGRFARRARVILGHDAPTRGFANTVCGECGGELRAAIDGVGDVFCAGTPESGSCGTKYTSYDVISLAMDLEAASGTEASRFGAGSDLLGDAAPSG